MLTERLSISKRCRCGRVCDQSPKKFKGPVLFGVATGDYQAGLVPIADEWSHYVKGRAIKALDVAEAHLSMLIGAPADHVGGQIDFSLQCPPPIETSKQRMNNKNGSMGSTSDFNNGTSESIALLQRAKLHGAEDPLYKQRHTAVRSIVYDGQE